MRYRDAVKLHTGDEVTLKKSGAVERIVEVEILSPQDSANGIGGSVSVMLNNGEYCDHKEIA